MLVLFITFFDYDADGGSKAVGARLNSPFRCSFSDIRQLGGVCVVSCYRLSDSVRRERGEAAALIKNLIMFEMLRRNSVFTSP